jgi:hypothetical protein
VHWSLFEVYTCTITRTTNKFILGDASNNFDFILVEGQIEGAGISSFVLEYMVHVAENTVPYVQDSIVRTAQYRTVRTVLNRIKFNLV